MPRSSRHKSHKQHKHSSKDVKEHSGSEEDGNLKDRRSREQTVVRVSRDSASGEKRKVGSQSQDVKDQFGPGNGDLSEDYVASKRRKERADGGISDRWNNCGEEQRDSLVGEKETKGESSRPESEKGLKSKVLVDSKSKSSRRHEGLTERKEDNVGLAVESEGMKSSSSKVESKRKSEKESDKDLARKGVHQYKEAKEKERGAERDRKVQDVRRERSVDKVAGTGGVSSEVARKQESPSEAFEDKHSVKREVENTEWRIQDELRNPELEKELEKRIRKRDGSGDKDKYQDDAKDGNERRLSSRDDGTKSGKFKDERFDTDKYKDDRYREKYREDLNRDHRQRDDKRRDDRSSRDHTSNRPDTKHFRDESKTAENRHKKSKPQDSDRDGSPHLDDRGTRYKDNSRKKRSSIDNEDHSDLKSRVTNEHRSHAEKKSLSNSKLESPADKGRSQSRHVDVDSTVSSSRWKSSPSSSAHVAKDQHRHSSKQAESKYRDSMSEARARPSVTSRELTGVSGVPGKSLEPRSVEKHIQKDENFLAEVSTERSPRSDAQASPMQLMEKSPSSTSIDHRYSRSTVKRSLVEETGRRSGSKDARDYSANEDRGSRELPLEKSAADEFSQADGDTGSISSSFKRGSHFPSSSSSLLPPPPFRAGIDSPSVLEDDRRGKSINRYSRSGDPSVGRGQGNAWKGIPNWPVTNGFIPFQHGPPPGGFHAVMQQFPAPPLFGVRPAMELNHTGVPYHIPDADRFSGHGRPFGWQNPVDEHLIGGHGWDGNSGVFGDESHMYGRPEWDQNRHLMSGRGWETSAEMWKGHNGGVNMELPTAGPKEDHVLHASMNDVLAEQPGQRSRNERSQPGSRAESIEIKRSSGTPPAKDATEAPVKTIHDTVPGTSKISNDVSGHFFHVYLSKLDISVDLTPPELYNTCMSLLDKDGSATVDENVAKFVCPEEHTEAGVKISSNTLSASIFPTITESIFQRAMDLYKKQGEVMRVKLPIPSFPGSESEKVTPTDGEKPEPNAAFDGEKQEPDPAVGGEKLDPVPTSNQENREQVLVSNQEKVVEPLLTSDREEPEPISIFEEEKVEELVPNADRGKAEEADPTQCQKAEKPVSTLDEEKPNPNLIQDNVKSVATSHEEKKLEVVKENSILLEYASRAATKSLGNNEYINSSTDTKNDHSDNNAEEQKAFSDTKSGPLGFSDRSSEALMPESIECRFFVPIKKRSRIFGSQNESLDPRS